jgi:cytochrome P450
MAPTLWDPVAAWARIADGQEDWVGPAYEPVLSRCSISRTEGVFGGFWSIVGFDQLCQASEDPATFSNVVPLFSTRRPPLESDPPEHTQYRRLLNPQFSAEALASVEPRIRRYTQEMLQPLVTRGSADFAAELSHPLPARVLCTFLGIDDCHWRTIKDFARAVDRVGHVPPGDPSRSRVASPMLELLRGLGAASTAGEGMIERLHQARIGGRPLSPDEMLSLLLLMVSAGHNTTTSALGNLVLRLARDRDLQQRLREEPNRVPDAIEECLRIDAPQQAMRRRVTASTTVAEQVIGEGELVWLCFGAANVDPSHWDAPGTFDLDRADRRHLAFGRGIHRCVGAPLARLELRIVIEELLAATTGFSLAGPVRRPDWPRMGVSSLPVLFER